MKLRPEELEKLIKGISNDQEALEDGDFYDEFDKDDMLGRKYPGVVGEEELKEKISKGTKQILSSLKSN